MNAELRMDLADCGSPEKLIAVILKHHPTWVPPVPVEELALKVGIEEFRELEADTFEGALVTDPDRLAASFSPKLEQGMSVGDSRSAMNSGIF